MPEETSLRRMPSVFRNISEIKPEDIRVSVLGTVVDKDGETIILDDGTGQIRATFYDETNAAPNQLVRVIGRVMPLENGVELQGEILQDMTGLDIELFKKINSIKF